MARFAPGRTAQVADASRMAAANACCRSRSDATAFSQDEIRAPGLANQARELGNVRIPLNERGQRAEPLDREAVQLPDLITHRGAMVVHQYVGSVFLRNPGMSGEMD